MVMTYDTRPATRPALADMVEQIKEIAGGHAAEHDRDGTFAAESYAAMKQTGFLAAAVPTELGGLGYGLREMAEAHHDLAAADGSAALASAMHTHSVLTLAWRHRRGAPVEKTLLRVADEGLVIVTTGGADYIRPSATARRVEGGFSVSGRKLFASQAPAGSVLSTWAVTDDPEQEILGVSIPMNAPGLEVVETWDAHGMRGTGSHDIVLHEVFVPEAQATVRRPLGKLAPGIRAALINGLTVITATYLGVVDAARREVVSIASAQAMNPATQRLVGQVEFDYAAARLALEGAFARLGDDPEPTVENFLTVLHAKRAVAEHGARAIEAAMQAAGGQAFYRTSPLERLVRDFRGINYHPLTPEATLFYAGRVALGGDPEEA